MGMRRRYLDLMERALEAYRDDHIVRYFDMVKAEGMTEHGFPRLTANIGILIAHGKKTELKRLFTDMMTFCCESFLKGKAANDFSVKEIIFCIIELEGKGIVEQELVVYWKKLLSQIDPCKCYNVYALTGEDKVYNWACFTGVSEYMRQYIGLADTAEFVDTQVESQLKWLDENKMYKDPNNPMVYDMVTRGLFAVLLHFGYRGRYQKDIDECLRSTGILTLQMQSVSGEIPYGGRSNQFPHNEAHLSLLLEYEARRYAKEGDIKLAGVMKAGVKRALDNIEKWLSEDTIHHVKNYYPIESKFGCEDYAYFDKYMITVASFLYVAYLFCDESIPLGNSDRSKPYTLRLSPDFHKIFLNAGGYFAEYDTNADNHYDVSGLGRVHREGVPEQICLSVPCTSHPGYTIDLENSAPLSICPGYRENDRFVFGVESEVIHKLIALYEKEGSAVAEIETVWEDWSVTAIYCVSDRGVDMEISGVDVPACLLPVFAFDGITRTDIQCGDTWLKIFYKGHCCTYYSNGVIENTGREAANRNGRYHVFRTHAPECLRLRIVLE